MLGIGIAGPLGREHARGRACVAELRGWEEAALGEVVAEREALTVLATVDGLGPATLGRLLAGLGGARAVLLAAGAPNAVRLLGEAAREAGSGPGVSDEVAARTVAAAGEGGRILARIREAGLSVVTLADESYPRRLRTIALPPHVLFVRGDPAALNTERAVAVVGTRRPTDGGRRLAAQVGSAVARCGAAVVSGLAMGVDGAAHAAVVAEGGRTVAVLGGGHARLYPRAHARLADAIGETGGAVISEFPPDVTPSAGTFPRRNRLISGLSEATVVIEAAARSGALTTAAWALEQGRGCFLVPGAIDARMSAGCLAFLRECAGEARIVTGIPQLLEDLALAGRSVPVIRATGEARVRARARPAAPAAVAAIAAIGATERRVAEALVAGLATVDELVAALDLPVAAVLGALTLLEVRGLVDAAYGRYRAAGPLAGAISRDLAG